MVSGGRVECAHFVFMHICALSICLSVIESMCVVVSVYLYLCIYVCILFESLTCIVRQ